MPVLTIDLFSLGGLLPHFRPCDTLENSSLRVAVPTPRGKTGGRERLRRADTNRVM